MTIEIVVVGARGHTGSELLPLLHRHPAARLVAVGSSSAAGEPLSSLVPGLEGCHLRFADIRPENLQQYPADLYVLALPNGQAAAYVAAIEENHAAAVVIDLSADYRFDASWVYGQPERFADRITGAKRISNPGCYATGAQLALAPVLDWLLATPVVFGVSGYSGAGKTPSRRNDPAVLRDNLLPYSLAGHIHEREITRHLDYEVRLLPHVVSFFRGISLTMAAELNHSVDAARLLELYREFYAAHSLISVCENIPEVADVRGKHGVIIGGFTVSGSGAQHASWVCVLDNLLKGAATQVVQNMNLAFALPALTGLETGQGSLEGEAL
ncbi:MAG TPA: N-acetyl-gamma-glutamyl-phosphate reductase [Xanthomonadales bacterium]|nr:N-acetyl-gamma-glutamyl-phosphate reductase [Xanthomonadales bacterium]